MSSSDIPIWKQKARARQAQQLAQIPAAWRISSNPSAAEAKAAIPLIEASGILSEHELEITSVNNTACSILAQIHNRQWTSEQVVTAFCKRAAILQQLTGCLTEIMFESAIARAKELDIHLQKTGQIVGPLHGLPLSLKDNHDIEGVDSSVGWIGLIGKPASKDVPAVSDYRALGAVLYVKTNVPQSLMMSDSYNHVFGQSVNSLNRELISGGSSGGEGALVAAGGSTIGLGTDIGGSVRIPATLQGLYGLSPTVGRIGNRESIRSQKYMCLPVAGPLTRNINDMELFLKSYWDAQPWTRDPGILDIPWRQQEVDGLVNKPRLRIGYVIDDGLVRPQPPVARAVRDMVDKLQQAGHEVLEWDASDHRQGYELWLKAVLADGGERCNNLCKIADEPLIPGMLVGKPEDQLDHAQRQDLADQIWDFQREYMQKWNRSGVDALIMPVTQWVGMRPKVWVKSDMYVGYTAVWNLLNWTALAVPGTKVSKDLDQEDDEWERYQGRSFSDQFNHDSYDIDLVDGMPVGIQVITGRFGEERAIAVAKMLASLQSTNQ